MHICLINKHSHVLKNLLTLLIRSTLAVALSEGMVLTKLFQFSKAPLLSPLATVLGGDAALPFGKGCACPVEEGAEKAGAPISCKADHKGSQPRSVCHLEAAASLDMHMPLQRGTSVHRTIRNRMYNRVR